MPLFYVFHGNHFFHIILFVILSGIYQSVYIRLSVNFTCAEYPTFELDANYVSTIGNDEDSFENALLSAIVTASGVDPDLLHLALKESKDDT